MAEVSAYAADVAAASSADLPWGRLSGCNILVTGATGLIGGCLVDVLMARPGRDYRVFAAGRNAARAQRRFARYAGDGGFCFVNYDVNEKPAFATDFHYVVHAAGGASPAAFASSPVEVMRANFNGTDNLLSYGMAHGLRRFLYVSSGEVYGQGDGRKPFAEGDSGYVDCATARACYPSAKRAAETLCASYAAEHGADVVIARPCHTYGPHFTEADNRVYAQFIRNVLRGEDIVMKSDGSQLRSWCYVADCACALLHILLKGERGQAYNVADPSACFSIRELAEAVAAMAGRKVLMELPPEAERRGYSAVTHAVFDTRRLESLGWRPAGRWQDKMRATIEEQRAATF